MKSLCARVLKLLPPLNISHEVLTEGLDILEASIASVLAGKTARIGGEPRARRLSSAD